MRSPPLIALLERDFPVVVHGSIFPDICTWWSIVEDVEHQTHWKIPERIHHTMIDAISGRLARVINHQEVRATLRLSADAVCREWLQG